MTYTYFLFSDRMTQQLTYIFYFQTEWPSRWPTFSNSLLKASSSSSFSSSVDSWNFLSSSSILLSSSSHGLASLLLIFFTSYAFSIKSDLRNCCTTGLSRFETMLRAFSFILASDEGRFSFSLSLLSWLLVRLLMLACSPDNAWFMDSRFGGLRSASLYAGDICEGLRGLLAPSASFSFVLFIFDSRDSSFFKAEFGLMLLLGDVVCCWDILNVSTVTPGDPGTWDLWDGEPLDFSFPLCTVSQPSESSARKTWTIQDSSYFYFLHLNPKSLEIIQN